jgi:hypothetical protein
MSGFGCSAWLGRLDSGVSATFRADGLSATDHGGKISYRGAAQARTDAAGATVRRTSSGPHPHLRYVTVLTGRYTGRAKNKTRSSPAGARAKRTNAEHRTSNIETPNVGITDQNRDA